ncbi:MAG: threonine synthase [Gemmatimonadales bacterium]
MAVCAECLGPLEPQYDPARALPTREEIAARPRSLWRYREWLPFAGDPVLSLDTGFTPLVEGPALARALGVARAWIKHDGVSHPSLSFKDRVVAAAINAAVGFGIDTLACASTGNLANAVAAHAARAGLPAWIFVPDDLEAPKLVASAVYGARVVRVRGTYDDVNRLCAQLADRIGWGIVNVNLRAYYAQGSKTTAFEIAEQLGWRTPSAVVAPMAGGSLVSQLGRGFGEVVASGLADGKAPRIFGGQASGCAPIVDLVWRGGGPLRPVTPRTIARSLAIGSPADGAAAARTIRASGGWAAAVSDEALAEGIALLARTTGVFTETAGGVTVAAALALSGAGRLGPEDEVVLCITGNGLKTPDAVPKRLLDMPVIAPRLSDALRVAGSPEGNTRNADDAERRGDAINNDTRRV